VTFPPNFLTLALIFVTSL